MNIVMFDNEAVTLAGFHIVWQSLSFCLKIQLNKQGQEEQVHEKDNGIKR